MTQEDKQLLLKDLCARLLYWPKVKTEDDDDAYIVGLDDTEKGLFYVHIIEDGDSYDTTMSVEDFKPYLRPMSSMTEEEREIVNNLIYNKESIWTSPVPVWVINESDIEEYIDFCNSHHLDYRGLIEMGLALEAKEEMYES